MKEKTNLYLLSLQNFSDGSAVGTGTGDGTGSGGEGSGIASNEGSGVNTGRDAADPFGRKGKTVSVALFSSGQGNAGNKTEQVADASETDGGRYNSDTPAGESFEDLIKGKYKADFDARVKDIISKRFKNRKDTGESLKILRPMLDELAKKYSTDGNDYKAITAKFLEDNGNYAYIAEKEGVSAEFAKKLETASRLRKIAEAENAEYRRKEEFAKKMAIWESESSGLKEIFPDFNLREEMSDNPEFFRLIASGVNADTAYKASHFNDIVPKMMEHATSVAERKISNNVAVNLSRPVEAGMGNNAPATSKVDVAHLSKAQRMDYFNRALRGEKNITF